MKTKTAESIAQLNRKHLASAPYPPNLSRHSPTGRRRMLSYWPRSPLILMLLLVLGAPLRTRAAAPLATPVTPGRILMLADTLYDRKNNLLCCAAPFDPRESMEAGIATLLGFIVDFAYNGAVPVGAPPLSRTWSSIPQTLGAAPYGLADYRAICMEDPRCGRPISAVSGPAANPAVWGPVIQAGNTILDGEDWSYHWPAQAGPSNYIYNVIKFVTDCAPATGLHISLSCYYLSAAPGTPVPFLDALSTVGSPPRFKVRGNSLENMHIVANHVALNGLTDANLSNYGNSSHDTFDLWASDFIPLVIASNAAPLNFTDANGHRGTPYVLARGKGLVPGDPSADCCVTITNKLVECIETNMTYKWDFCITNCWTNDIKYLSFVGLPAGVTLSEDIYTLASVLQPKKGLCLSLFVTNTPGLTNLCFTVGAHTTNFNICCATTNCLKLAPCCVWISGDITKPIPGQANCYAYNLGAIKNVSSTPMTYLFLLPQPDAPNNCFTFTPNVITFSPPLLPGQFATLPQRFPQTVTLKVTPSCPRPLCYLASAHNSNLVQCCSSQEYITRVNRPVSFADGFDGTVFEAGTPIRVPVVIDTSIVRLRRATLYDGTSALETIPPPTFEDGQHDDYFAITNAAVGTHTLSVSGFDDLDLVWPSETATIFVFEHQHPPAAPGPILAAAALVDGKASFAMQTEAGVTCYVECADSLTSPVWTVLQTIVGDGSVVTVTDSPTNTTHRFYRVRIP